MVIAVVIDEPKVGARDGGGVAAPIFKQIAEHILPELGVKPDGSSIRDSDVAQDIPEIIKSPNAEKPADPKKSNADTDKTAEPLSKNKEVRKRAVKKPETGKKPVGNTIAIHRPRCRPSNERAFFET